MWLCLYVLYVWWLLQQAALLVAQLHVLDLPSVLLAGPRSVVWAGYWLHALRASLAALQRLYR